MSQKVVVIGGVQQFLKDGHKAIGTTAPIAPYDVTVTVDKTNANGTNATEIGASHIQHSLEYKSADPAGVTRAMNVLRNMPVDWNMTHMTGSIFALRDLTSSAGQASSSYAWPTSGSTRGLDGTGGEIFPMLKTLNQGKTMLVCHSAAAFQAPGRSANDPPTPAFFSDYANEVVNVIIRSETSSTAGGKAAIRAVGVWNEMKGYYTSGGRNQTKTQEMADLFSAVYTAVKAHDSTILVTGPHINLGGYTDTGRTDPLKSTSFGGYDRNTLNWWLNRVYANGTTPDAVTLDYSIVDYASTAVDIGNLPNIAAKVGVFSTIKNDCDAMVNTVFGHTIPVWWIEQYFDVNMIRSAYNAGGAYTPAFQAAMIAARYCEFVNSGIGAAFTWQPDSRDGIQADGWWTETGYPPAAVTAGTTGSAYSGATALTLMRAAIPKGTALWSTSSDQTYMKSIASSSKVILINLTGAQVSCRVLVEPSGSQVVLNVPAWGVVQQVIT